MRVANLLRMLGVWMWIVLLPAGAQAGDPRTHDGFFLRLSAGFGYAGTKIDLGASDLEVTGATGDVNFAIGGIVAPNLALHGTILGWSASEPDVELTGVGSGELNGDVTMSALGAGVTYYFMPSNLYLSGTVGFGRLEVDLSGGPEGDTDAGLVLEFVLGKEWWTGDNWGLGLAGAVALHSIPDGDLDEDWKGTSLGLRFSATLN